MPNTLTAFIENWAVECPDKLWLQDREGDNFTEWNWAQAYSEIQAAAAWLEQNISGSAANIGILSRNRAHWVLADQAIIASGHVTIPMFTTLPPDTASYVMDFTDMKTLIVGESENWESIKSVLPEGIQIIALPGVDPDTPHTSWNDLLEQCAGQTAEYQQSPDDLISIVFTSGTTGLPKGVMQDHNSFVLPIQRFLFAFELGESLRFLSYLPLSHIAERQLVGGASMINCGTVSFNESMSTLVRDLGATRPTFFFGPPRVWEQIQQMIIGRFDSQEALDKALEADRDGTGKAIRETLGLDQAIYLLTAAAPTPPALIEWFGKLGLTLMEGFGQTEAMGLIANSQDARKIGSIGRAIGEVEIHISEEGELQVRAIGISPGYYKDPEKTAETFVNGWVYTGDKAYVDDDGFIFLTGRVKDYFKTIQGKFVAPPPIEASFSDNVHTEQQCLLGRGYSKTVMVCVLSAIAQERDQAEIEQDLRKIVESVNDDVEKHARMGALIISADPWSIDNGMLTPTLKIRREQVEKAFGELAQDLARKGAERGELLVHWH